MCRIAVLVSDHNDDLSQRISVLTDAMAHGGPDDAGCYIDPQLPVALGHRRLSIIDTSDAGHQPMASSDNRYQITFNGEIYNYRELRTELSSLGYTFRTNADTEVLLAGYSAWGDGLPTRLRGMFAFVILDRTLGKLFAARDHAGIKPLYFAKQGGDYFFTSEVRALQKLDPDWEPDLDWPVLFLTFGFIPEPYTTLKNVRPVKKGHWMLFDIAGRTWKEEAWYHTSYNTLNGISAEEAIAETRHLLEQSMRRHLVADVPVGIFLSGGLDSSAIAVLSAVTKGELPSADNFLKDRDLMNPVALSNQAAQKFFNQVPQTSSEVQKFFNQVPQTNAQVPKFFTEVPLTNAQASKIYPDATQTLKDDTTAGQSITTQAQINLHAPLKTLSIDFEDTEWSEQVYQNLVAKQIGSEHHRFLVNKKDFIESWPGIFESLDQPTTDAINSHFICRYAKQIGLKVVLSGLGGDEVFGGYPSFSRARHFRRWQRLGVLMQGIPGVVLPYALRKLKFLPEKFDSAEYLVYRGLFTPNDVSVILGMRVETVREIISRISLLDTSAKILPASTRAGVLESDVYMLNQLLKDADVQSMWHGVELRVPFLDSDLMHFIHSLPDQIKFPKKGNKFLLRNAVAGLVDPQILNRKKQGFVFPFDRWFREMNVFDNKNFISEKLLRDFHRYRINYSRIWAVLLAKTRGRTTRLHAVDLPKSKPRLAFIFLAAFDITGGIEKVNKVIMHCLDPETKNEQIDAQAISLHDERIDPRYFPAYLFNGFGGRRLSFLWYLIRNARRFDAVLVGHLNLALAALLMRLINPKIKILVMVHGIEAWRPQKLMQRLLLKASQRIISVSLFTANILATVSNVAAGKITVIPNCLDPFYRERLRPYKPAYLLKRYEIAPDEKILLTITRLNKYEKYKGYDQVIKVLPELKKDFAIRYIVGGKGDNYETDRLRLLAEDAGVTDVVHLPGFIPNDELQDHYRLADVFVMPSRKEGFGLVLIEAAAAGLPVIAGNADGSVEAMQYGLLGQLVNPEDSNEISSAIKAALKETRGLNRQKSLELYDSKKYVEVFNNVVQEIVV